MRIESVIQSSFNYTKKFCFENKVAYLILFFLYLISLVGSFIAGLGGLLLFDQWIILSVMAITLVAFLVIEGYLLRVCSDKTTVPGFGSPGRMLINSIKSVIIIVCWMIPAMICLLLGTFVLRLTGPDIAGTIIMAVLFIAGFVLYIYLYLYAMMAFVRFSKTEKIREGFNYSALKKNIRTNGWFSYIISLIILSFISGFFYIAMVFLIIFVNFIAGIIVTLVLIPPLMVFCARYLGTVYEEGDTDNFNQDYFFE